MIPSGKLRIDEKTGEKTYKSPYVEWAIYNQPGAKLPTIDQMKEWEAQYHPTLWGFVTGRISGILGYDLDNPKIKELFDKAGIQPHVKTKRAYHYYGKWPGHEIKNSASKIYKDFDVRGDGGFINCIGENETAKYEILIMPSQDSLINMSQLPLEIKDGWAKWIASTEKNNGHKSGTIIKQLTDGSRHNDLISYIGKLRSRRFTEDEILTLSLCLNNSSSSPLSEREVTKMVSQYEHQNKANGLPEIIVNNRQLRDTTEDTLRALYQSNKPERLFIRNARLTRINIDEHNRPFTDDVSESSLRGDIARSANFVKMTNEGPVSISPPLDVVKDIQSLPNLDFPALVNIVESPVIRSDGTVLTTPGYDVQSRLYFYPNTNNIPKIPDKPTSSEIQKAITLVNEVICDFPFDCPASHDNALACMFTPIINPMINDVKPGTIIDKPQAGTGASFLCRLVSIVATGHDAPMLSLPDTEDEIRKEITSLMIKGQTLLIIDNVENKLQSASLASLLTTKFWQARVLGQSKEVEWPNNMIILVNGNNIRLGGDLPRRFIWVRMDAKIARPWQRDKSKFKHPELIKWALDDRVQILAAILTIAQGWICAGKPQPEKPVSLGGYETYSSILSGILHFVGADNFMGNLDRMYDEVDQDTPQWEGFFEAWHESIKKPVTVKELFESIKSIPTLKDSLPDSLSDVELRNYPRRLGIALSKKKDYKLPNGLTLKDAGSSNRSVKWQVMSLENEDSYNISLKMSLNESSTTHTYGDKNIPYIDRVNQNSLRLIPESKNYESIKNGGESDGFLKEDFRDFNNIPEQCPVCHGTQFSWINERWVCAGKCRRAVDE